MLESGLVAEHWAIRHGIRPESLNYHVRRLLRDEPELFVLTKHFCPCPLMARLICYRDARVREYLKRAWFEIAAAPGKGGQDPALLLAPHRRVAFGYIEDRLGPSATAADVGVDLIRSIFDAPSRCSAVAAARGAILAAAVTGVNDGDPLFEWVSANEERIRATRDHGSLLRRAVEGGGYRAMRLVQYVAGRHGRVESYLDYGTPDPFLGELLDGFLASREQALLPGDRAFFSGFAASLGFVPSSLGDFSPETFGRQVAWFRENLSGTFRQCACGLTRAFYLHLTTLLPDDQQAFTFETGLPPKALGYGMIVPLWLKGYKAVVYEPLDPEPRFAKWLLYPNENEVRKASYSADTPKAVDCSVSDPALERLLVGWVWSGGKDSFTARASPAWIKVLLERVVATGLTVVGQSGSRVPVVSGTCVHATLSVLAERNAARSLSRAKGVLRAFLSFAEERGSLSVEPACYLLLESVNLAHDSFVAGDRPATSDAHLAALAEELERMSSRSIDDELTYIAYITQALTDLRFSEVLSLRVADLDASGRSDFEAVRVCRKSGGYGYEVVEVPREVHRLLHTAVRITEPVRSAADASIAEYVFLIDGLMGTERVLSTGVCSDRMARACERLGIPAIRPSDVRRAYETTVIMEGAKRNWSRMLLRPITGHADIRSDEHYIAPDIMNPDTRRYLEGAYVVEIGKPKIRGEVLPDVELGVEAASLVESGAGICRNADCDILGTLPCFECPGFATAPRFIPEMIESIAILDGQIGEAPLHQRSHLMEAKRRRLAYLGIMIDMDKETKGGAE